MPINNTIQPGLVKPNQGFLGGVNSYLQNPVQNKTSTAPTATPSTSGFLGGASSALQTSVNNIGSAQTQPPIIGNQQNQPDYAGQIKTAQDKVSALQNQLNLQLNAGYGGDKANQEPRYDLQGGIIPTNQLAAGGTQANTNPYTAPAPTYPGLVGGLANMSATSTPEYQAALKQYNEANAELEALRKQGAEQTANIAGSRTNLAEAGGEQGIMQNLLAGKESALTGEMTAAQAAAQVATGQQSVQQAGMGNAAGLAAPQQVGPTNVPFNPVTGEYGTPAANAYGTNGNNGLQNVGNISGQINVGQNVAQLNSYLGGAQVVGDNLNNLITTANINPTPITYANGALQFGANLMSNPDYRKFAGQINDFVNSIAPILGAGGNVTDLKTQMSNQIVNGLQSGSTIKEVVSYFLGQAKQKIQGMSAGGGVGVGSTSAGRNAFGSFFGQ